MSRLKLGADIPAFRISWRGYDRAEVEEYLHQARLREAMARVDPTEQASEEATTLLEDAKREAQKLKDQAEQQAREIVETAQRQAAAIREETDPSALLAEGDGLLHDGEPRAGRSEAAERELARLTELRTQVAQCLLEIGAAAERDAHRLLAIEADQGGAGASSPPEPMSDSGDSSDGPMSDSGDSASMIPSSSVASPDDPPALARDETPPDETGEHEQSLGRRFGIVVLAASIVPLMWLAGSVGSDDDQGARRADGAAAIVGETATGAGVPVAQTTPIAETSDTRRAAEEEHPAVPPQPELAMPQTLVVTLTATEDCWISALVDGADPLERLMQADETIMLHAREEAVVRVGNAAALSMLINNQPAKPLGSPGQVVNLRITHQTMPSYLEHRASSRTHAPAADPDTDGPSLDRAVARLQANDHDGVR